MKFLANGFTTELPEGWVDRSMITLVGTVSDATGFASNVVIMRERVGARVSVEDYAAEQRRATEAELPNLEVLDERPTKVNGAAAFQRLQRFNAGGQQLQQAQTYILGKEEVFVITCTMTVAQFDENAAAFRRIVENFSIV